MPDTQINAHKHSCAKTRYTCLVTDVLLPLQSGIYGRTKWRIVFFSHDPFSDLNYFFPGLYESRTIGKTLKET